MMNASADGLPRTLLQWTLLQAGGPHVTLLHLHIDSVLIWGFVATLVLTTILSGSQQLRLTRMSLPLLLGTLFTGDWDRALRYGFVLHVVNGWGFSLFYGLVFESLGWSNGWLGALLAAGQALFLLGALLPVLPSFHPRMASLHQSPIVPSPRSLLEPPGFMGLNYGVRTPLITFLGHLFYGVIVGAFYEVAPF